MFDRAAYQLESGKMQSFAFPGGYPIFYVAKDSGILCPDCAGLPECQQATPDCPDDAQWFIIGADCNYEDPALFCDHCGKRIESAYCEDPPVAPPVADETENLDCMETGDLQVYSENTSNPTPLREYAASKARAQTARLAGKIPEALELESACDRIYKQLPASLQW